MLKPTMQRPGPAVEALDPSAESKPGACREQLAIHERSLAVLEGHESHRQEEREQLPSTIAELAQDTEDHTTPEETVANPEIMLRNDLKKLPAAAKKPTAYVQLGGTDRRNPLAPGASGADQCSMIVSEMSVLLERFVDIDPSPTGGNKATSSGNVEYDTILEAARGLQQVVRTNGSSKLLYDDLHDVVSNCDLVLQRTPPVAIAEQIRKLLVIIARPMVFLSEDTVDTDQPATRTGGAAGKHGHGDVTSMRTAPAVIVALIRKYFGPEADFIPEIPLWFAGNHTANECETMLKDKTNGTFLIRDSETKADTLNLTLRYNNFIYHFRIYRNIDGDYFIAETDTFPTLWELVRHHSTKQSIGSYTIELLFPVFSYASNPWYHGHISKQQAESLLSNTVSGCYLVRRSASEVGGFTLTLRMAQSIHHYRIVTDGGRTFCLNKEVQFESLEQMIKFYAKKDQGASSTPKLVRSFARESSHEIDLTDGQSYIYVNLNAKAQPVQANPPPAIGSGFGKSGFYQRRYMKTLELRREPAQVASLEDRQPVDRQEVGIAPSAPRPRPG